MHGVISPSLTDVVVLEVLEEGDLPDGGAGRALLVLQPDLLEGDQRVRQPRLPLEHRRVRPLTKLVQLRVRVHLAEAWKSKIGLI